MPLKMVLLLPEMLREIAGALRFLGRHEDARKIVRIAAWMAANAIDQVEDLERVSLMPPPEDIETPTSLLQPTHWAETETEGGAHEIG